MAYYTNKHCIVLCTCDLDGDPDGWFDVGSWEPTNIPFTGQQGPTSETDGLGPDSDPVAFFQQFLTDELIQHIVDETNRYAEQCISQVCVFLCVHTA